MIFVLGGEPGKRKHERYGQIQAISQRILDKITFDLIVIVEKQNAQCSSKQNPFICFNFSYIH